MCRLPTCSSLQRVAACPASAALPHVNGTNGAAQRGTAIHEFICNARSYGADKALTMAPESVRSECAAMNLAPLHALMQGGMIAHEVTYAFDVTTGSARLVGVNLDREYDVSEDEVAGTADICAVVDRRVIVLDMKTGRHPVAPAADNWQLKTLALMASKVESADAATLAIAYLQEDGEWVIDRADLDAMDLDAIETDVVRLMRRVKSARADVDAGITPDVYPSEENCRWCPAVRSCPATTALVRQLPPTLADIGARLKAMTPGQLGESWEVMERAEAAIKIIREGMMAILRQTPFTMPSGKTLRVVEGSREYINGQVAQRILVEQYGADVAVQACKPTVTKASLKTVLKERADEAIEAIRAADGISTTKTFSTKES